MPRSFNLDVEQQVRSRLMLCLDHLDGIEAWRKTLDDEQRTRWAHPDTIWMHYRRSLQPVRRPAGRHVQDTPNSDRRGGRPIFWDGDSIKRAAMALRENCSGDFYVMARKALEAAIRDEGDLFALLRPETGAMSALPRRADIVGSAGYVG